MSSELKLKEKYILAKCCSPESDSDKNIIGYFSHDDFIKVHLLGCENLAKADKERLIPLQWDAIIANDSFEPDSDYQLLDATDFAILSHHKRFGIDYSLRSNWLLKNIRN